MTEEMLKFKVPHPGENPAKLSQEQYNVLYAEQCDNCGTRNRAFGKHIVSYYAHDKKGNEIESLSLCLECRFQWLRWLVQRPGFMMHREGTTTHIQFVGILLPVENTPHLRILKGGDVLQ